MSRRLIPVLSIIGQKLVKTRKFKNPKYVGDPLNAIKIFNEKEVDELIIADIRASERDTGINFDFIEQLASECFIPITYAGGIQNYESIDKLFKLGIEKVCIKNSILDGTLSVKELVERYGGSSIVGCFDIKKSIFGAYKCFGSKKLYNVQPDQLLADWTSAGIGEILINSVDGDGTLSGLDTRMISNFSAKASCPIIFAGGANSLEDVSAGWKNGANAIAIGSLSVFSGPHRAVLINYPKYETLKLARQGFDDG